MILILSISTKWHSLLILVVETQQTFRMVKKEKKQEIGVKVKQKSGVYAFIPEKFPPPGGFVFSRKTQQLADDARHLLGRLDGIAHLLPDVEFFLFMFVNKDATSSSQIEGTNATLSDVVDSQMKTKTNLPEDVDDVIHYIKALNYGLEKMTKIY